MAATRHTAPVMRGFGLLPHAQGTLARRIARFGVAAAALVALALGTTSAAHAQDTLADAVALTYATNPTLAAERARLRALDEGFIQARAGRLPSLSGQLSVSATDRLSESAVTGIEDGDTSGTSTVSLSARQSLYEGGRISASMDGAQAQIAAGRENLRSVEQSVLLSVVEVFMNVRRDEEVVRIRRNNVAVLTRQLEAARSRFEVGEITRTDVAQAEARLAAAQAGLADAEASLIDARAAYAQVVGQEPMDLSPQPPLPGLPGDVAVALDAASANNPSVRAAEFAEAAARANVRQAQAALRPSAALTASASRSDGMIGDSGDSQAGTIGGTVSIPLFTGGLNQSRVREAREAENRARIQVIERERVVRRQVLAAWSGLDAANRRVASGREQVRASEIAFEGVEEEARVGFRTTLDVLDQEQELLDARLALINAERDAYVAGFRVLEAVGDLSVTVFDAGVTPYDPGVNSSSTDGRQFWPWRGDSQ